MPKARNKIVRLTAPWGCKLGWVKGGNTRILDYKQHIYTKCVTQTCMQQKQMRQLWFWAAQEVVTLQTRET